MKLSKLCETVHFLVSHILLQLQDTLIMYVYPSPSHHYNFILNIYRFPEVLEEIAVNLTDFVTDKEAITLEHVNALVSKRVRGGKGLEIGDRTRPNAKVI